jgi:hypothetical protein
MNINKKVVNRFIKLFNNLAFDYDRLSKSGQETYCEMQRMLDIITEEEEQMTIDYINKNNTKSFGSRT